MSNPPPPDVAAAAAIVDRWVQGEEAADRARANPQPSAIERFNDIRRAQYVASQEGRTMPVPTAPVLAIARTDLTLAERWGIWRDPRG